MMKLSELPADQAQYLGRFGADAAVRIEGVGLSQVDFEKTVLQFGTEDWTDELRDLAGREPGEIVVELISPAASARTGRSGDQR
jgi:hypothetical protein